MGVSRTKLNPVKKTVKKNKTGRPSDYTPELADRICDLVATNAIGLKALTEKYPELPCEATIRLWCFKDKDFSTRYWDAKRMQASVYEEQTLEIADEQNLIYDADGNAKVDPGHVAWCKNRINVRQWHAAKISRLIYGDKVEIIDNKDENAALREEILALRKKLEKKSKKDY